MSVVAGEINDIERAVWSKGDRAERYREQAGRLQRLADMERQPRDRERLLDLAGQYRELADHVAGRKMRTPPG